MTGTVDARLKELGIEIPTPAAPAANYVPFVKSGNLVFVSGQIPIVAGTIEGVGTVGKDYTVDEAKDIARICAINLIAQAKAAADGDLDRIQRVVKLGGFVNCVDEPLMVLPFKVLPLLKGRYIFDSIFPFGHMRSSESLQTTARFSPSGRDLSALLGSG